ncbi:MAG: hypothetical protein J5563_04110 [Clostridia bacterium]|nr:hypothetical protein [Clostridia bacterium]
MKKLLSVLIAALMLFSFFSCGESVSTRTFENPENEYLYPEKRILNEEQQDIADRYYAEMIERYPQFGEIPREMLFEYVYHDNLITSVEFTFCLGGIKTDCHCLYQYGEKAPDGEWHVYENGFQKLYEKGISDEIVSEIRSMLEKQTKRYVRSHALKDDGEYIPLMWSERDGKLCACSELIAHTTLFTLKKYGCGDHAHVYATVVLDISGGSVTLTNGGVTGS